MVFLVILYTFALRDDVDEFLYGLCLCLYLTSIGE
jgi:hypothetical protein